MQVLAFSAINILALKPFYDGTTKESQNDEQLELNRRLVFQILISRDTHPYFISTFLFEDGTR